MLTVRLLACAGLLSSGCDLLFKVDHVDGTDGGSQPHPIDVSGTFQRRQFRNQAGGSPKIVVAPAPAGVGATATFRDGSTMQVSVGADGTFAFHAPDTPYTLTVVTELGTHAFQLGQPNIALIEELGGRDLRAPAGAATALGINVMLRSPTASAEELQSTAVWTRIPMMGATPVMANWATVVPLSGPIGLLSSSDHDAMYYAGYEKTTFLALTRFAALHDVTLANNSNNNIPMTSVAVTLDRCANVSLDTTEMTRVGALVTTAPAQGRWVIGGAAAQELMPDIYFPLVGDALVAGTNNSNVNFANPYDGLTPFLRMEAFVDGAPGVSTVVAVPVASTCNTPTFARSNVVKLATDLTLAGTKVTGQPMAIDHAKPVAMAWTGSDEGAVDYWVVSVNDINAGTAFPIVTTSTTAFLDPNLLQSGHMYELTVTARIGSPNASSGDFTPGGTTVARGRTTTAPFVVQ